MPPLEIRSAGRTDPGLVREENQDSVFVDEGMGLYLVLDGMGGHQGGATASRVGCEVIVGTVKRGLGRRDPAQLLVEAIQAAGARVHHDANMHQELHGMGTTVVAMLMPNPEQAIIAHVGDSRAYLLRDDRLRRLTSDHTVVAELVAAGRLTPEQAFDHPHASVLSRNLGGLPTTEVELGRFDLTDGDRVLLCSDGLNGYAGQGAIEQVLNGAENAKRATSDLIDLAKRGGGGDNVSAVVVEVGRQKRAHTSSLPETGASAWWQRRPLFIQTCERMGLAGSVVARTMGGSEALEFLAGSFCEAVYHDLENTTGVHVWTYADSLVKSWFARDQSFAPIQELFDILRAASMAVVSDVSRADENFGVCLEIALLRALIVGEMVIGGQLGQSIQEADRRALEREHSVDLPDSTFTSVATIPFASLSAPMPSAPEVSRCLREGLEIARRELKAGRKALHNEILKAAHRSADEFSGEGEMTLAAREVHGSRLLTENDLSPIVEALDACRIAHLAAIDGQDVAPEARATAYRAVAMAHQSLYHAVALVAVDAGKPTTDRLREMHETTAHMRERLARNEQHLAALEEPDTNEELRS